MFHSLGKLFAEFSIQVSLKDVAGALVTKRISNGADNVAAEKADQKHVEDEHIHDGEEQVVVFSAEGVVLVENLKVDEHGGEYQAVEHCK